jgi:uncharacterized membrane protein YdbT with pleckstrin-like domain
MAGYIEKHLMPGEAIEYRGKVTKLILLPPLFWIVSCIVVLVIVSSGHGAGIGIIRALAIIGLIYFLLQLFLGYIAVVNAEYAVTDRRVIGKYGAIRRQGVDILFTQISGVELKQGFFGRVFGYGGLDVAAAGAHRKLNYIKRPLEFRVAIYSRLEESRLLKGTAAYTLDVRNVPSESTPASPASPPAGGPVPPPNSPPQWAPDPYGEGRVRYWDGSGWTDQTAPAPQAP